ncbi:DoxX family protein [Sulfobacillus thermosulfidooxidans]|uniref:DoxX family protein n=1 Tax=Sulfobacillus thermosulfidooxidans TaxID=28034 RepID=UPI001112B23F|nr:DoxX family protein [Sulfobacillus thermosulfidooxidans]
MFKDSIPNPSLAQSGPNDPTRKYRQKLVGGLRIVFGVFWLIDARLKWSPAFFHEYVGLLKAAAVGQPPWLQPWFHGWIALVSPHPDVWAVLTALIETVTALGLIFGFAQKLGYLIGSLFSLAIWSTAEGFGGPYTPGATDIGTSIIYFLVFVYLAAMQYMEGLPAYSLDRWIIAHWTPWRKIATFSTDATGWPSDHP